MDPDSFAYVVALAAPHEVEYFSWGPGEWILAVNTCAAFDRITNRQGTRQTLRGETVRSHEFGKNGIVKHWCMREEDEDD